MAAKREIKTPGVTAEPIQEETVEPTLPKTTAEQAEESLDAINSGESEGEKEPSQERTIAPRVRADARSTCRAKEVYAKQKRQVPLVQHSLKNAFQF
ncbi:hypothetical protein [Acinetobacter baumannii]|uniref:hypothetical protein n=1 Tax=Acinetobacter baumannii TaxID=470 RepID=UPI003D9BD47A